MTNAASVTISHNPRGTGGRYIAAIEGESVTGHLDWELTGSQSDPVRVATHTIVPPSIGGRGIAALLVERLIADARAHGFKVAPQCSYVAVKFDRNPDWAELRA